MMSAAALPVKIGRNLQIVDLGKIVNLPAWHTPDLIFPMGFRSAVCFENCHFECEIRGGCAFPLFVIKSASASETIGIELVVETCATAAYQKLMDIMNLRNASDRVCSAMTGALFFGFGDSAVRPLLERLEGAHSLAHYARNVRVYISNSDRSPSLSPAKRQRLVHEAHGFAASPDPKRTKHIGTPQKIFKQTTLLPASANMEIASQEDVSTLPASPQTRQFVASVLPSYQRKRDTVEKVQSFAEPALLPHYLESPITERLIAGASGALLSDAIELLLVHLRERIVPSRTLGDVLARLLQDAEREDDRRVLFDVFTRVLNTCPCYCICTLNEQILCDLLVATVHGPQPGHAFLLHYLVQVLQSDYEVNAAAETVSQSQAARLFRPIADSGRRVIFRLVTDVILASVSLAGNSWKCHHACSAACLVFDLLILVCDDLSVFRIREAYRSLNTTAEVVFLVHSLSPSKRKLALMEFLLMDNARATAPRDLSHARLGIVKIVCFYGAFRPVQGSVPLWERFLLFLQQLLETYILMYEELLDEQACVRVDVAYKALQHDARDVKSPAITSLFYSIHDAVCMLRHAAAGGSGGIIGPTIQ
eukprot:TRINITY_DN514_c0_g1_i1.p2 TRINITY_DN514_c0_g1~~TRINITY_DN514_c0_g1_i1.p2  ORF type:complete len:594 (-),score=97.14 TRINITY_DN514_c0_g1_i1:4274-6055(-)